MDLFQSMLRNPAVQSHALRLAEHKAREERSGGVLVDIVVLTGDVPLFEAIRGAVGERNPVWRARSAEESVELLLSGRCGVMLIDMGAVSSRPATLIEEITGQFPDVVVVVAGRREDEAALAGLVSEGLVYRFMHKPLTPKRAGMFLNAAIRSHVERRGRRVMEPLLPIVEELRSRLPPRRWLLLTAGLALFLALIAVALLIPSPGQAPSQAVGDARAPAIPAARSGPLADPVLSRARAAFAAGRYEAPPGRNALDLYAAVLLARPGDAEARAGFDATVDRLLTDAADAAGSGRKDEARRTVRRVLGVDPGNREARTLLARIDPPAAPAPARPPPATVKPATAPPPEPRPTAATRVHDDGVPVARNSTAPAPPPVIPPAPKAKTVELRDPVSLGFAPFSPAATDRGSKSASARVQRDPLTPVYVNGASGTSHSAETSNRVPAAAPPPVMATAGYVDARRSRTPAPDTAPRRPASGPQNRDLQQLRFVEPAYPPGALRQRTEGWVEVEFTVDERGTPIDIEVVDASPRGIFEAAAREAVAAWRYRPRRVNGQDVAERTSATLRFSVDD
jgi:TonB family protein